jgi:hypothetical protein
MTNIRKTILMTALSIGALSAEAGDNLEAITNGGMVIRNRVWANSAMPLDWALNDQGAINNNSVGAGTPNIPIADLRAEVQAAFMSWQAVANSDLTLSNLPDTATFDIGCDLENIVTWADTTVAFPATTIARGVTTVYVGAPIVLDSMNRTVVCSDGSMAPPNVTLPAADYPDGMTLQPGTILDMDMVWNAVNFDYVLTPNATASVFDVLSVATHEFGHLFGLSHSSMAFTGVDRTTMFPFASSTDVAAQIEQASLEADDERSSAKDYPGTGAFPNGVAPFTTGAIAGRVTMPNGAAVQGARIWFYNIADTSQPVYETFTATQFDADLAAGEYALEAVAPGNYYACIVPWSNGAPPGGADNPARYNASTNNGVNHTAAAGWATECFPDFATGAAAPDFDGSDPDDRRRRRRDDSQHQLRHRQSAGRFRARLRCERIDEPAVRRRRHEDRSAAGRCGRLHRFSRSDGRPPGRHDHVLDRCGRHQSGVRHAGDQRRLDRKRRSRGR